MSTSGSTYGNQDEIHGSIVACFLKLFKHLGIGHELLS